MTEPSIRRAVALRLLRSRRVMTPRVRVAIALTSFERGGTERQMTELIRRLDRARFEVHVLCFRAEGPWLADVQERAASLVEFRLGSLTSPHAARQFFQISRWLRERRIAVLHACDLYANIVALPAAALAHVRTRVGSRRGIVAPVATRGLLAAQHLAYRSAHRIVANSAAAALRLRQEGVPARKIVTIPNGIDVNSLSPAPRRPARRVVTTVANLRRGKGHDVLLDAAAEALRTCPDLTFELVGEGPLRSSLEAQAAALGVADRVKFAGHRDDVAAVLLESDVFAFPSLMEAFPNAVMEAMAASLPVVATNVGGIPELVEHERNGLLVPAGDPAALASAIVRLVTDGSMADTLGRAARHTMQTRYSFEPMVAAFEALYLNGVDGAAIGPAPPLHNAAAHTRDVVSAE